MRIGIVSALTSLVFGGMFTFNLIAAQNPLSSVAKSRVSLSVSTPTNFLKIGAPILVDVVLTNNSDHDMSFSRDIRGRDLQLDVRDASGKLRADTKLGYIWNRHVVHLDPNQISPHDLESSRVFVTLKPGDTVQWVLHADQLYDMSDPGKYSLIVQRSDPENSALPIRSNTITITLSR